MVRLRVGDLVSFRIGSLLFRARVIEDRGGLGVRGRQLVGIEVLSEDDSGAPPERFEMPAEELIRLSTAA